MSLINNIKNILKGIIHSYSQVFFSDNKLFAAILLVITFFDFNAGVCGAFAIFVNNILGHWLGFDKGKISGGIYGFNSLLVGLGMGIYFEPGLIFFFLLFLSAILTFFLTIMFEGVIGKYTLPYLSIPFVLALWTITIATREFESLGVSQRGIYTLNDLYIIGGDPLIRLYQWWNDIAINVSVKSYFTALP